VADSRGGGPRLRACAVRRRGLRVWVGIGAVYGARILATVLLVLLLAGPVVNDLARLPTYTSEIVRTINSSLGSLNVTGDRLAQLASTLVGAASGLARGVRSVGRRVAGGIGGLGCMCRLGLARLSHRCIPGYCL